MCFVFWVCFKQKPWLILREQKRNVILHLQSRNYQTWIQQCRVTTFVCVFLWVCVHIKVKIYKKRWQSKLLQCLMWSAVVVYEKVRCQCRNKEPTVKVQQVEQVRIVSEFVLGFFAVCATRVKDTWVSTQRIRLCFCVVFFTGKCSSFCFLVKTKCSVCSQDVIWGFQPLWVFVVWSLKDFIFLRGVCVLREEASFKYWIHFKNVCSWDDSNIGTLRTRQLGHKVMNSQDCWQVCSRGVSRLVKKRLAWGTLRKLLKPNKISSVSCICTHQLLP